MPLQAEFSLHPRPQNRAIPDETPTKTLQVPGGALAPLLRDSHTISMEPNPDPWTFLPPDIMANPGPDRLNQTLEVCRECGKFRATTLLLPVDFGAEDQDLDTFIIDPEEETSAT